MISFTRSLEYIVDIYRQRLQNVRSAMLDWGLDTLVLTPGAGMKYLSGFSEEGHERLLCLLVPDDRDPLFITPALNAEQARANSAGISDIRVWDDGQGWDKLFQTVCKDLDLDIGILGVAETMEARFLLKMQELLPTTLFKSAAPVFQQTRIVKDSGELASLQHAADITDRAVDPAYAACRPGATELEVALVIQRAIAMEGVTQSFDAIVGAGPHSALPHHAPGSRKMRTGDVIVLDFGARFDGYCGDITRVVALSEASDEAKHVYRTVYAAHQAALAAAKPGVGASDVDAAARAVITEAGFGEFFIHRTGHGIGLDEHENPNIVMGNHQKLAPGMCFSIEPGIYLPGKFGVRLENIVTITEGGCRSFNTAIPAELPILG